MTRLALIAGLFYVCALICSCGSAGNNANNNPSAATPAPGASGGAAPGGSSGNSGGSSGSTGSGGSSGSGSSGSGSAGSGSGSGGAASAAALAFAGSSSNQFFRIAIDGSGNASTSAGSPHSVNGDNLFLAASGKLLFVDGHFASNDAGDSITAFRSDANGGLTNLGSVTADGAAFIAAESSGRFIYASADTNIHNQGFTSPAIYGFAVDQGSGKLTALPGSPWALNGEAAGG